MRKLLGFVIAFGALADPAVAEGVPQDIAVFNVEAGSNLVRATVQNVSSHEVSSFKVYFNVFDKNGKFTETVEANFVGHLRAGAKAQIKGPIYKSFQPGPPIVNTKGIEFFL